MIEFKVRLPSLPPIPPMPNLGRYILITVVVVSMLMSATSIYVTLAAPQHSTYVPTTIGFEGQLADAQGTPVTDGSYQITFNLYNAATGGSPVWTETQPDVEVKDGLYSVQLGSVTAFGADTFNGGRWLGIKVGSDAEMAPRISVGAVPFALNAKYAQGLQNNPVADTAPSANNALMWSGSQWEPKGMTLPDLSAVGSNASPNDLLANYRSGAVLRWKANDTVEVAAGELMVSGYMRRNTSAVDVKFAPDAGGNGPNRGLDTGTAQSNTTYYIYAVADDAESTFDLIISASSSAPTGRTNYRKLGSFKTVSGSTAIAKDSAVNVVDTPIQYPRRASGFHINDTVVTGGALFHQPDARQPFGYFSYQNPPANGDIFVTTFMLQAGTYSLHVLGITQPSHGKIDWYIDDVLRISGQDWYGSQIFNIEKSGSITVVGDGYHVLKGVVNGKNASSTGYYMGLTQWWIASDSN